MKHYEVDNDELTLYNRKNLMDYAVLEWEIIGMKASKTDTAVGNKNKWLEKADQLKKSISARQKKITMLNSTIIWLPLYQIIYKIILISMKISNITSKSEAVSKNQKPKKLAGCFCSSY